MNSLSFLHKDPIIILLRSEQQPRERAWSICGMNPEWIHQDERRNKNLEMAEMPDIQSFVFEGF